MSILRFESWCRFAVSDIRDRADRERVYGELYAHMEDQYEELIAGGMAETEAEKAVVAAMGDFGETAKQLEKLYPPIWGRLLSAARLLLLLAFLMAVTAVPRYIRNLDIGPSNRDFFFEELSLDDAYGADLRTFYAEPMSRDSADGYRFTLTRAAERRRTWEDDAGPHFEDAFYLTVEVFHPCFWGDFSDILREFYAVDSLGNRYESANLSYLGPTGMTLSGNPRRTGLFTCSWEMWLYGYRSQEADWLELRYDESGRSVRLCVDRKGGGGG